MIRRHFVLAFVALLTTLSVVAVLGFVRLDPNVLGLIPSSGDGAALSRYVRGFGGGGLGVVLIEGPDAEDNRVVAEETVRALGELPGVSRASAKIELGELDPLLAWRTADAATRARLAAALEPDAMSSRLRETRQLLLAPGSGAATATITRDPLRLGELTLDPGHVGSGLKPRDDGYFATPDGLAHLVVFKAEGQALRGADARALVAGVSGKLEPIRRAHPDARIDLTGPHAVAAAMETMVRGDLQRSSVISVVLASAMFALVFRRVRALVAILPPLLLGTLWTASLAALWPSGISAIAIAFTSVVVGVGFDTGVHVYAALLHARRGGLGPLEAASAARARTARPVLTAALIAAAAFASLSLSSVSALRQLGLLCAAGELLTAVAILAVTPELGALLERGPAPPRPGRTLARAVVAVTSTRARAALALGLLALAVGLSFVLGTSPLVPGVHVADSIVAVRPSHLAPLEVESRIFERFGGEPQPFIVLVADPDRDRAMSRADAIVERLASDETNIARVDALTALLPSVSTQEARLAERDALDLPGRSALLERALVDNGFAVARFRGFLDALRDPPRSVIDVDEALAGELGTLGSRHLAVEPGGDHLVAIHVHLTKVAPSTGALLAAVQDVDPAASVTGYARLEADLRSALRRDLPIIGSVAAIIVGLLLAASLRRAGHVALAAAALLVGLVGILAVAAVLSVPLHIYSVLVIPVLLGVSADEAMFLLHDASPSDGETVGSDDPIVRAMDAAVVPVVTTALTTAAGFGALAFASYSALVDLGTLGAAGNAMNLLVALVLIPAGLRLTRPLVGGT